VVVRNAADTELVLGQQAYDAGFGTSDLREQISALNAQIHSAKTTKDISSALQRQRRGLLSKLANTILAEPEAPTLVAEAYNNAQQARGAVLANDTVWSVMRARLPPQGATEWWRIGIGYGLAVGVVAVGVVLLSNGMTRTTTATTKAGQFLVEPSDFFGWFTDLGMLGVALLLFTLSKLHQTYLLPLTPRLTVARFGAGIAVGGTVSILLTLLLTFTSIIFFDTVIEFTTEQVIPERARVAGINQVPQRAAGPRVEQVHIPPGVGHVRIPSAVTTKVGENKYARMAITLLLILLVIGAGYAFTTLKLAFWNDFAAMSAGVGLPEELMKGLVGLLLLYQLFNTRNMPVAGFRRCVLVAFGIAGLGFGAGEAFKYFGAYRKEDTGLLIYAIRATWCVTLHGSWTLIVGTLLSRYLPQDPKLILNELENLFWKLLMTCILTALAHGLYNACCNSGVGWTWVVGGLSILAAFVAVHAYVEEKPGPEDTTSQAAAPIAGFNPQQS